MRIRPEVPANSDDVWIEFGCEERYEREKIVPIRTRAQFVVFIDGHPYCGFGSKQEAQFAIDIWRGLRDGAGRRTTEYHGCHWPAIEGRAVEVIDMWPNKSVGLRAVKS